jgi:hypothetical protein
MAFAHREAPVRDLNYALKQLCGRNRDGSFATQANRQRILDLMANQLHDMGYRHMSAQSLKPKHAEQLAQRWLAEGLSAGTIKNRMTALRWWAEKIGKDNVIARTNDAYGIPERVYVTNISKGKELDMDNLQQIPDPFVRISLALQALFGLRREESIKLIPALADQGDRLTLKSSWTKGGRPRQVPIRTPEQRQLIDAAKALARQGSLIRPDYRRYRDYLKHFRNVCERAGIHAFHGHRHFYAQERYREMTGWECPARGAPTWKQLTPEQRVIDREARLALSREMGHNRVQITAVYLGT